MHKLLLLTSLALSTLVSANEDIRNKVVAQQKEAKQQSTEIILEMSIFGHLYGTSEDEFIKKEGKPNGYIHLNEELSVMIYGKNTGFIFRDKKLVGTRINSGIIDWELANQMKLKSRFDRIEWSIAEGVEENMSKEQVIENLGEPIKDERGFTQVYQKGKVRLTVNYARVNRNNGPQQFEVYAISILRSK